MPDGLDPPAAIVLAPRRWSWAWLVPLGVLVTILAIALQAARERPIGVEVRFVEGSGLRAGDPVTCRGVQIGVVREVRLAPDASGVVARLDLSRDAAGVAVEGSRFWIVRPEVSLRGVSGLDSLLGPRCVSVSPGEAGSARQTRFDGLERIPVDAPGPDSLRITLRAPRRGSLSPGSPVLYRDVPVGRIFEARLAPDARGVELVAGIEPRYAALVRDNSRFFNVSGISADWGIFGGLSLRTDSLESVVAGGVGFATPDKPGAPALEGHAFDLAEAPEESWLKWRPAIPLESP